MVGDRGCVVGGRSPNQARLEEGEWAALDRWADVVARRLATRSGFDEHVARDVKQAALLALCEESRQAQSLRIRSTKAWVRCVMKRGFHDIHRGRPGACGPARCPQVGDLDDLPSPGRDGPEARATRRDLMQEAERLLGSLPPPHREIACRRFREDWSRREVIAWLRLWRPVGEECARKLLRQTNRMLWALGHGVDVRGRWPGRFSPKRNRFLRTPLPPLRD